MTGDHQIRQLLMQASDLLETRHREWGEQLQGLEEEAIAKVKEQCRTMRSDTDAWKKEGIKYLAELVEKLDSGGEDVLKERMTTALEELQTVLDRVCVIPLPAVSSLNFASFTTENKPFAACFDAELPLGDFWSHKLYILDSALTSLEIVNLLRMEIQRVPLINNGLLAANPVWTVLSTGELFVCGGGQ
jgi:hypothetical protein